MGALSKTARASGATGKVKKAGPTRIEQKYKRGHRAHKKDSPVIPAADKAWGKGRDARKAAKRAEVAQRIADLVADAAANLDARHETARIEDSLFDADRADADVAHDEAITFTEAGIESPESLPLDDDAPAARIAAAVAVAEENDLRDALDAEAAAEVQA